MNPDTCAFRAIQKSQNRGLKHNIDKRSLDLLKNPCCKFCHGIALHPRNGPLKPTSETPGVKGYYCDTAGSSEGAPIPKKAKHPGAEWWACLATPTRLPRILAGRQRAWDQDSPCTNTDRVAGHLGSSRKAFIPKHLISGECVPLPIYIGVLFECCVSEPSPGSTDKLPQNSLFCFGTVSLHTLTRLVQTLLWEDQAGSAHSESSITDQTLTKTVSNRAQF